MLTRVLQYAVLKRVGKFELRCQLLIQVRSLAVSLVHIVWHRLENIVFFFFQKGGSVQTSEMSSDRCKSHDTVRGLEMCT